MYEWFTPQPEGILSLKENSNCYLFVMALHIERLLQEPNLLYSETVWSVFLTCRFNPSPAHDWLATVALNSHHSLFAFERNHSEFHFDVAPLLNCPLLDVPLQCFTHAEQKNESRLKCFPQCCRHLWRLWPLKLSSHRAHKLLFLLITDAHSLFCWDKW